MIITKMFGLNAEVSFETCRSKMSVLNTIKNVFGVIEVVNTW